MTKLYLLISAVLISGFLFCQNTKKSSAKFNFLQRPTVPVEGLSTLGIQVYTSNLPFNKDTLRLYLRNIDLIKSDVETVSKVKYNALNKITVIGGEGDITIDMAFGKPMVIFKELKTSSCLGAQDGCVQYYYMVKYSLPAVVQARNSKGILNSWKLNSEMELQFGNEQIETHQKIGAGSATSIRVINYKSKGALIAAFKSPKIGGSELVRKGIITQIGRMADLIYDNVFFDETKLKLDIAYGSGRAADYSETEKASEIAVAALENQNYASLSGPITIWKEWISRHNANEKRGAVSKEVAQDFHENLSIAYTFIGKFDKARQHLEKALEFAQTGFVSENEVRELNKFLTFIDKQEDVSKYNNGLQFSELVTAPDIKDLLVRRKYNEHINFLIAEDKYSEISNKKQKENVLEHLVGNTDSNVETSSEKEVSIEGRVENNMLILSGLVDQSMRGKAFPSAICKYPNIKIIRARNIGFTSLPECMGELVNLEKLYINSNSFKKLPDIFLKMQKLEVLDISNNNLKSFPPSIFTLTNLKKLYISGNQFSDVDIKKLKESLPKVEIK